MPTLCRNGVVLWRKGLRKRSHLPNLELDLKIRHLAMIVRATLKYNLRFRPGLGAFAYSNVAKTAVAQLAQHALTDPCC